MDESEAGTSHTENDTDVVSGASVAAENPPAADNPPAAENQPAVDNPPTEDTTSGVEEQPTMPVDPDGIPIMEEAPEELLVDFGKVPQSKSRSEFEDSLYPVSVADHNQISDATSKLLHRLHYDPYDEDEVGTTFMFVALHHLWFCFYFYGCISKINIKSITT